jgi:SpoIID/LytB domain protein
MRSPLVRTLLALSLAHSFSFSLLTCGQEPVQNTNHDTRPRRANVSTNKIPSQPAEEVWKAPQPQAAITLTQQPITSEEPTIRVALSTSARSGVISTTGKLMNATGTGTTFLALNTGRVRVEPRLLSPLSKPTDSEAFRIKIDGAASRAEAEKRAHELEKAFDEEAQITYNAQTNGWGLLLDPKSSQEEADEILARLIDAGFDASLVSNEKTTSPAQPISAGSDNVSNVRLASRASLPSREVIGSAVGSPNLLRSSAPVLFASDDEKKTPVRYNDRPYRGRIEVFTNTRGTLTVVNVIGLEDYVRGVVANELSPGSYPALDALKAQAIAARTYALKNRGQFMSQGFDLLPTTRSQVYRGLTSENPLTTRAVDETRGIIATYHGEPINALYTSTCGGRTEDSENIFNETVPYLRSRECANELQNSLTTFTIQSSRELPDVKEEGNVALARETALLALNNFALSRARLTDSWLNDEASVNEVRNWLATVARLAHQTAPAVTEEVNRPGAFATALNSAMFGENRADTLLNTADVEYYLAIRDASEVPVSNRADVAELVRDGFLSVHPDATLRPREPLSRARALHTIARALESRGLLQLQKGTARPTNRGELILKIAKGKDQTLRISPGAFLFRQIGDGLYPVRSVLIVGGEPVLFHLRPTGEVDYLEVRPAPNGASAERFSPFTNWSIELSLGQVQGRLAGAARGIGPITDLRVLTRGASRRVVDLEIIGAQGTAHVRGGKIRSALGLREQLFVIDRKYDDSGRASRFVFTGRGWGHGVGMCQVGAYGLAKQGWNYEQILKAYYTGIELTRMY